MPGISAVAGAQLYIGGAKAAQSADFVEADFSGESWVAISWVENIGSFGDEAAEIAFDAIGEGRTQKLKGNRNAGNMEVVVGADYADTGQNALRAAEATPDDYAFRVEFDDLPPGGTAKSQRYFVAKVMTAREVLDGANSVIKMNATLGINSNVVRVNAF